MSKKITFLIEVTSAVEAFVTQHGAYFDKTLQRWVVEGEVPPELESFVEKTKRARDYVAESTPQCDLCGCQMVLCNSAGGPFWGCSSYRCGGKKWDTAERRATPPTAQKAKVADKPAEQPGVAERKQEIYERATRLFGSQRLALGWLQTNKVGLDYKTPVDVMRTLEGCDLVERLLRERFDETG